MPFLFASLAMQAVGRVGGLVVDEVRRQFREIPGILEGTGAAGLQSRGGHRHELGDQEDAAARAHSHVIPIVVGIISPEALGGLLIGTIVTGIFLAIAMTSGGAWDNAKKPIEDGAYGGKGLGPTPRPSTPGYTVGDPQGHRRPGDQPDDQDRQHRRHPDHPDHRLDPLGPWPAS